MNSNAEKYTQLIKPRQKFWISELWDFKSRFLRKMQNHSKNWLKNNFHGEMKYMENHFDKRLDPRLLVEGSKSVISLSYNYFPEEKISTLENFKISKYAYAEDYHEVIKDILRRWLLSFRKKSENSISCFCRFCAGSGKKLGEKIRNRMGRKKRKFNYKTKRFILFFSRNYL
jgi:epoxyqueuosine reductase